MDWFLYDNGLPYERVNLLFNFQPRYAWKVIKTFMMELMKAIN